MMFATLDTTVPQLPADRPRYLMGVGRPADIVGAVKRGIDMFDCVHADPRRPHRARPSPAAANSTCATRAIATIRGRSTSSAPARPAAITAAPISIT